MYSLSLHDALPISSRNAERVRSRSRVAYGRCPVSPRRYRASSCLGGTRAPRSLPPLRRGALARRDRHAPQARGGVQRGRSPLWPAAPRPSEAREVYTRGDCWLPSVRAAIAAAIAGSVVCYSRGPCSCYSGAPCVPIMGIARGAFGLEWRWVRLARV